MNRTLFGLAAAVALVAAVGLTAAVAPPASATEAASGKKDPARAVTSQLICPCSCGEILSGCTCETGKAMQAYVDREVKSGKSKDQIEAALVSQYGQVILGAPKAKGFNLLVWVLPFAATAFGFAIATFFLFRWARRRNPAPLPAQASPGSIGPSRGPEVDLAALRARAEEELRRLQQ